MISSRLGRENFMKTSSDRCRSIIGITALVLAIGAVSQANAEDAARSLAEQLIAVGEHDAAITEFKRFLFFHTGDPESWLVALRIADCYRTLGRFPQAIAWYERSSREAPDEHARSQPELDAASVEIAAGSYSAAEFRLLRLRAFGSADALAGRDALFLGLAYLLEGRTSDADRELSYSATFLPPGLRETVTEVLDRSRAAQRLSPSTAKLLSTLLPGAGQVYTGHYLDGLDSLAVTAGSATLVAWCIATQNYAEAVLGFFYLLQRYYAGSRQNAERQALERNSQINRRIASELLLVLSADR